MNLEKLFFGDVHRVTSIRKKPPQKKSSLSFSGREIHLVLVFFDRGFSLFGTWNDWGGGVLVVVEGGGKGGGGLGWVGEEWRKKGLGWYIRRNTHTLGDCKKPHIAPVVWDIYAYLIRLDMICEPCCHKSMLFRCFPYAPVLGLGFFDFRSLFFFVSRGFLFFFERERESMGLFCLLGSRLVKM